MTVILTTTTIASGRKLTPQTARPLGSENQFINCYILQTRKLVKRLLNKSSNYVSLFGALLCFTYLNLLCQGPRKVEMARATLGV
jgi:hypothetical protein